MEGEGLALVDASHLCWGVGRDVFRADELYAPFSMKMPERRRYLQVLLMLFALLEMNEEEQLQN